MSLRSEIPQRAFLNAQILQVLEGSSALDDAALRVCNHYGFDDYSVFGPSHAVSLLYCLLVVPRELWLQPADTEVWNEVQELNPVGYFEVTTSDRRFEQEPVRQLFRRLRNSIAHARFNIEDDLSFEFRDHFGNDKRVSFVARADIDQLSCFLSEVGAFLANLRNSNRD